jgi:myo-inositol catabolism protein IolC
VTPLSTGEDGLFILAFDHRISMTAMLTPPGGTAPAMALADAKWVVFEGLRMAVENGVAGTPCALVDSENGMAVVEAARGLVQVAIPVELPQVEEFRFHHSDWRERCAAIDPDIVKALVRWNPATGAQRNRRVAGRLRDLIAWAAGRPQEVLIELLVPPMPEQLEACGADNDRFDAELRPTLVCEALEQLLGEGVCPDIWKLEGLERRRDCVAAIQSARASGRGGRCVVLGRGASFERAERWVRVAAEVDGYVGFAIGRSIFGEELRNLAAGAVSAESASRGIAARYCRLVNEFQTIKTAVPGMPPMGVTVQARIQTPRKETPTWSQRS